MSHAKQFIFGDPQAWIKAARPCGLRKAVKTATGTTCFVYDRGDLVKTFDVRELFQSYLKKRGYNPNYRHWDNKEWFAWMIRLQFHSKQDQNNRLLQKIRKLT